MHTPAIFSIIILLVWISSPCNGKENSTSVPDWAILPPDGEDDNPNCCVWAQDGFCDKNPFWVRPHCQKSCGTAGCQIMMALTCKVTVPSTPCGPPFFPSTTTTTTERSTTTAYTTTPPLLPALSTVLSTTLITTTERSTTQATDAPIDDLTTKPILVSKSGLSQEISPATEICIDEVGNEFCTFHRNYCSKEHRWRAWMEQYCCFTCSTEDAFEGSGETMGEGSGEEGSGVKEAEGSGEEIHPEGSGEQEVEELTTISVSGKGTIEEDKATLGEEKDEIGSEGSGEEHTTTTVSEEGSGNGVIKEEKTTLAAVEESTATEDCVDTQVLCSFWAYIGECVKSPLPMKVYCRKSCKLCK